MSTVIQEPAADVVCLGLGVMSGAVAAELTKAGHTVAGIEKGPYWDFSKEFSFLSKFDEWAISMMRKFDHPLWMSSFTIRNNATQYALPVRRYTYPIQYHALGHGVGGAAHHYGGGMGRFGPWTYQASSMTASRYGPNFVTSIDPTADLYDFPMTYQQYDPYYVEWENAYGISGTNQGPLVPFYTSGYSYQMKAHPLPQLSQTFMTAMEGLGYNPYPAPNSLASESYTNQYGITANPCIYEGWCGESCNYVCETGAKANSAYRTVPAAVNTGKLTMALNSYVFRLDVGTNGNITQARYYDAAGNIHVQPGTVFFDGLWGMNMYRIMALSGIGQQYNPTTVTGSLGRGWAFGYAPTTGTSYTGTVSVGGNAYPAGNAAGSASMFDLADDNFDHTGLGFIGGATVGGGGYLGGGPSNLSAVGSAMSPANIGSTFKATLKNKNLVTKQTVGGTPLAPSIPSTTHYLDLDPHHVDMYGDPLTRGTLDWGPNENTGGTYIAKTFYPKIVSAMGATNGALGTTVAPGTNHVDWWGHHQRGAMRTGSNSSWSVFNKYMQSWTTPNIFAAGEICNTFGTYVTAGTHPGGALSYVAAEGIQMYLATPGPLV